ncbi:segregation/condensation protein A [Patescibacteria group bacterium]|nr:segregation/condensation protein A [Patescibacteria group bacterium]
MDNELIYKVKTESFEGPLGVLLNMIERRKLFINDISLAQISDDYISYLRNSQNFSIKDSADFILIASALMLIKSRSLLPNLNLTLEEEKKIDDLEGRLKAYKEIRDLSEHVKEKFGKQIIFQKTEVKGIVEPVFSPDKNITKDNLFALVVESLTKLPKKQIAPKKSIRKIVSLEEMIDSLTERIKVSIRMSFNDFSKKDKAEKVDVVVSFLAMLELFKQGVISVKQSVNFGDIDMENKNIGVPHY